MASKSNKTKLGFSENFVLSGVAAAMAKTGAAPIERVKLLLQNQGELIKQGRLQQSYGGVRDCIVRTYSHEGIRSFWRGNFASVIRYFPQQALNFAFKDEIQKTFKVKENASHKEKFAKNILSGGCAGSLSLVFIQSIDYTRTRLGVDAKNPTGQRQFNGIIDCYVKTVKADGLRGLYRGFWISCSCIFIYRGLYFGLYDTLKPIALPQNADWIYTFLLGWGVTIVSGISAYPLDTVKRRMMMTAGQDVKYPSSLACAQELLAREGAQAFFKGAGVNIVRGVAGACVLSGSDWLKKIYISKKELRMLS